MIEKDILIQAQSGNEEAIEEIIKQHEKIIYVNGKTFFLKDGEFSDLLQEGYIGLIKAIQRYDESKESSFSTFANICIRRQMITAIKKSNTEKYRNLNEAIYDGNYCEKEEKINYKCASLMFNTPEEILLSKELIELLEKYLEENLTNLEKSVFYYLIKQQTYIEIANILNETPKKIDNTIQRIKKKIREYLEKYMK